jgi:hypothetical protein
MLRNLVRGALGALVLFIGAACSDDDGGPTQPPPVVTIEAYIEGIRSSDMQHTATYVADSVPDASGGPNTAADGDNTVVWGGTQQATVQADADFTTVIVSIDGIAGYYRMVLDSTDVEDLLINYSRVIPSTNFDLKFQVVEPDSSVSDAASVNVDAMAVGTGLLQVTVSWASPADIDLHLVEPGGEEIYLDNPESDSGGELDLMSNANCVDGSRNENIFWASGVPSGQYTIRLATISPCGAASTDYVVTVNIQGRNPQFITGTVSGVTGGGQGAGVEVGTFIF